MANDLLLDLLKAGLLESLGDDDQRRERAEAAAAATGEWLRAAGRPHFGEAVIWAIDETSEPVGPVFDCVENQLIEAWPTLRNVYPESPNELLRAITMQGVVSAQEGEPDLEAAAWYLTRTVGDLGVSAGRWTDVVEGLTERIAKSVSNRVREKWAPTISETKLVMPKIEVEAASVSASTDALREALEPYADNLEGYHPQVSVALGAHVPDVLDDLVASVETIFAGIGKTGGMKSFSTSLGRDLRALLGQQAAMVEAMRLRETLLWWRLGAHSDLLGERYRNIEDPVECAVAAATDLHLMCPALAPEAVEHLLADVVSEATQSTTDHSPEEVAKRWSIVSQQAELEQANGVVIGPRAIAKSYSLGTTAVAVNIFRDLQAARLVVAAAEPGSGS